MSPPFTQSRRCLRMRMSGTEITCPWSRVQAAVSAVGLCRRSVWIMWVLRPLTPGGEGPYYLLVGVNYIVGRKNCAILLQDDQSISRSHATLSIVHPAANLNQVANIPVLTLKDTSKYGTFVNEVRLEKDKPRILNSGELVTFGVFDSKFRVEYKPLIVSSSCLDGPVKIALNQSIQCLGGHVTNSWIEDNTHLVMSSVKVTVKTICALICGRPIVKPEFFVDLIEAIRNKGQLPNSESYVPPIDEPSIKPGELDVTVKPERKSIFSGKTFFFLNEKQHKRLNTAIIFGGGDAKVLESTGSNTLPIEAAGSCVVDIGISDSQKISNSMEKWIESVMRALQRNGLRAIPEAEIGLAVIYSSTDNYCNPHKKPICETSSRTMIPGPTLSQSDMIAPELSQTIACVPDTQPTQDQRTRSIRSHTQVVEETPEMEAVNKVATQNISAVEETFSMSLLNSTQKKHSNEEKRQTLTIDNKKTSTATKHKHAERKGNNSSQKQSHLIHDYFQPVERKREREETGLSQAKFARTEGPDLLDDHPPHIDSTMETKDSECRNQSTQTKYFSENLKTESNAKCSKGNAGPLDEAKTTGDDVPQKNELLCEFKTEKRKHEENLEDDVIFSGDQLLGESKRRKVELDVLTYSMKDEHMTDVKDEPVSENGVKIPHLELLQQSENYDTTPSKLMLTVFKSLVVTQPGRATQPISSNNANDTQLKNFKKFTKVLYPGAKALPKIIGGTDLKAYQTKKNSEMEEWLRQEVEEQSQKAKEENLADDLFRYDPKSIRKR
ncbi:nibrin [Mobula hypostoma]|uniref:nibrin n=1 Tax=Mobula hypostoma TaxID=723540 RepID=UPI002FC2C06B